MYVVCGQFVLIDVLYSSWSSLSNDLGLAPLIQCIYYNYPCALCAGVKRLSSSVCIYICKCVCVCRQKNGCLHLTTRKSPQKGSLLLGLRIYSPLKKSKKSGESTSSANLWLSI